MRLLIAVLLAALAVAAPVRAADAPRQILPVDEGAADPTWLRFKKRLMDAVEKRDRKFVLSILDPKVRNQTEARGVAQFVKEWDIDAADSALWRELSSALQLGAAFMKRDNRVELCAPYVVARWPADVDPFDYAAIIARDTILQADPSSSSPGRATLSHHIVRVLDLEVSDIAPNVKQKWVHVQFGDRAGYVPEEHVRSPVEHAVCFVKVANGWRMTGFGPAGGE